MPRRNYDWATATSEQAFQATRSEIGHLQPHQMANTGHAVGKRKHELDAEEEALPSTPRTTKRTRTRVAVASEDVPVIDLTAPTPSPKPTTKKRKHTNGGSPAQKEEKRLRAFRKWAPKSYLLKLERARTQRYKDPRSSLVIAWDGTDYLLFRLFVLGRERVDTEEAPEEIFDVVGSTGNVYKVHIGKVPFCSCPDSKKGNQCKHVVYVGRTPYP